MKTVVSIVLGALLAVSSLSYAGGGAGKIGYLVDCQIAGDVVKMPMTACRYKGGNAR
jgi:hypothetical protein